MSLKRIAVVGGGFSGALVCANLVKETASFPDRPEIILFEPHNRVGRGLAYSTECVQHLLNVPAGKMGAWADQPESFFHWLRSKGIQAEPSSFMPRKLYGEYIEEIFCNSKTEAAGRLSQVSDSVTSISPHDTQYAIETSSGAMFHADAVILAIGNFSQNEPLPPDDIAKIGTHYVANPWSQGALDHLNPRTPLILIGGGLTAIDMILESRERGFGGPIMAISRRGFLPMSHAAQPPAPSSPPRPPRPRAKYPTLRTLITELREEITLAEESGKTWRAVIDALRPETQLIWRNLTDREKMRFLRHLQPYWEIHRHRLAPAVGAKIQQELEAGTLEILAGRVRKIELENEHLQLLVQKRSQRATTRLTAQRIINCSGPSPILQDSCPDLIRVLLKNGLCQTDSLGMGLVANDTGRMIGADGSPTKGLFVIGSLRKGELWETTAVPELRVQARDIARAVFS